MNIIEQLNKEQAEALGGNRKLLGASRVEHRRLRLGKHHQVSIESRDGAGNRRGQDLIASGHVVERAVKLHVRDPDALSRRDVGHRAQLRRQQLFDLVRSDGLLLPAEALGD